MLHLQLRRQLTTVFPLKQIVGIFQTICWGIQSIKLSIMFVGQLTRNHWGISGPPTELGSLSASFLRSLASLIPWSHKSSMAFRPPVHHLHGGSSSIEDDHDYNRPLAGSNQPPSRPWCWLHSMILSGTLNCGRQAALQPAVLLWPSWSNETQTKIECRVMVGVSSCPVRSCLFLSATEINGYL